MQPDELLRGLPGYPYTAWVLVLLALALGAARTWQNRPQTQRRTNANLGARLGAVERRQELERTRRLQIEHELTRRGLQLPYWPGDPAAPAPWPPDDDDDPPDEVTAERPRVPVPPITRSRHYRGA